MIASLQVSISAPSGDAERGCVRVKQDNARRSPCPDGGLDVLGLLMRSAGFAVDSGGQMPDDGVFRVPILSQDDGQGHSLSVSVGTATSKQVSKDFSELVACLSSSAEASGEDLPWRVDLSNLLSWRPQVVKSARFAGQVRNPDGSSAQTPRLRIDGTVLLLSAAVDGQLSVSYTALVTETDYELTPEDAEEAGDQVLLTISSKCGGLERVKLDVPDCWRSRLGLGDRDGDGDIDLDDLAPPDPRSEIEPEGADLTIERNVCTGETTETLS